MPLPKWYVDTKDVLADIWLNAGTKIIGYLISFVGALGVLDDSSIHEIDSLLGPKYAPYFGPVCLICSGLVVRWRGGSNQTAIASAIIAQMQRQAPTPASDRTVAKALGAPIVYSANEVSKS